MDIEQDNPQLFQRVGTCFKDFLGIEGTKSAAGWRACRLRTEPLRTLSWRRFSPLGVAQLLLSYGQVPNASPNVGAGQ